MARQLREELSQPVNGHVSLDKIETAEDHFAVSAAGLKSRLAGQVSVITA